MALLFRASEFRKGTTKGSFLERIPGSDLHFQGTFFLTCSNFYLERGWKNPQGHSGAN
jgi:hypothetical protein